MTAIRLVGFDADDTLWRSEDYFADAQRAFEAIVSRYLPRVDGHALQRLQAIESANLAVFGYGVKGMALSMVEAAVAVTDGRIAGADVHRIVDIAKSMLRQPVDVLPGVRAAVEAVAARHEVVLITKGDLFHQEAKVRGSGLAALFRRIEIVSEKDTATYRRLLDEFDLPASRFVMVGNSLRSDIAPVLALGGWGVHVPYHLTWEHERHAEIPDAARARMRTLASIDALPAAILDLAALAG